MLRAGGRQRLVLRQQRNEHVAALGVLEPAHRLAVDDEAHSHARAQRDVGQRGERARVRGQEELGQRGAVDVGVDRDGLVEQPGELLDDVEVVPGQLRGVLVGPEQAPLGPGERDGSEGGDSDARELKVGKGAALREEVLGVRAGDLLEADDLRTRLAQADPRQPLVRPADLHAEQGFRSEHFIESRRV